MFDPDLHLKSLKQTHPRLLFYPSCGDALLSCVLSLPYDVFVLSDSGPPTTQEARSAFWSRVSTDARAHGSPLSLIRSTVRTRIFQTGGKWGFLFFQDNNDVLQRISASGIRIAALVGIRDGCAEGGNYECVNEMPFLGKVLRVSARVMSYFTDHSRLLEDPDKSQRVGHRYFRQALSLAVPGAGAFQFSLRNVLYRLGDSDCSDPRFYRTIGDGWYQSRFPNSDRCSPLWKLLPFRTEHGEGIIGHYGVRPATTRGGSTTG